MIDHPCFGFQDLTGDSCTECAARKRCFVETLVTRRRLPLVLGSGEGEHGVITIESDFSKMVAYVSTYAAVEGDRPRLRAIMGPG